MFELAGRLVRKLSWRGRSRPLQTRAVSNVHWGQLSSTQTVRIEQFCVCRGPFTIRALGVRLGLRLHREAMTPSRTELGTSSAASTAFLWPACFSRVALLSAGGAGGNTRGPRSESRELVQSTRHAGFVQRLTEPKRWHF